MKIRNSLPKESTPQTHFRFHSPLTAGEKDCMISAITERIMEIYATNRDTVANVAAKFRFGSLAVAMFATSFQIDDSITIIGTECVDLDAAKAIMDEFHETLREFADKDSETSNTWVNPELN
jgi:hypothetical protein